MMSVQKAPFSYLKNTLICDQVSYQDKAGRDRGGNRMGLKSLIRVAQGKNASEVSFEDSFLKAYEEAVRKKDLAEKQEAPADYIRPSSMYGCERMIFFQRVYSGTLTEEQSDVPLIEICQSGTDRHLDIQHIVEIMDGVECLDRGQM